MVDKLVPAFAGIISPVTLGVQLICEASDRVTNMCGLCIVNTINNSDASLAVDSCHIKNNIHLLAKCMK